MQRISTLNLVVFVTITGWASQGQVIQSSLPALGPRHNMLHSKGARHKVIGGMTVLTPSFRLPQHRPSLCWCDAVRLHTYTV